MGAPQIKSLREVIIRRVQKRADTINRRIDAAIVSRVASMTLDEVLGALRRVRGPREWKAPA